ncbi:L-seryl-tRNA(Sec) selenium transferase [Microlunatus ginsengisoli]|uniref:L-seryl-tRNA(Sec) selenium transferase n=1 Tax=Microlunatus ginsengisoli TaxID=363863 RepID=A0ABP7AVH2_9ACTN
MAVRGVGDEADPRRRVPRTDAVLADPRLAGLRERVRPDALKASVLSALDRVRSGELGPDRVVDVVLRETGEDPTSLRPLLNATGVVVHTNLGRAPLGEDAVRALEIAAGYVDVEYDVATGRRARRGRGAVDALLARVPAAGDALVLNNGAAALVLAATALAGGREIVVSRGELVEIGDGFRIPELLESTGARLREVGTTNRTHPADYRAAIGPDTGFVLKVHPSNFLVRGFTSAVPVRELAGLGVPVVADIGSGLLAPHPSLPDEPDAASWLADGATLVIASGDKLLGGPQCGLALGESAIVQRLRRHSLARALRVDKLTLAALEATLRARSTPTGEAITAAPDVLRHRAEELSRRLAAAEVSARVVASDGLVGGGGAPGLTLPGWAVELPEAYALPLRQGRPGLVARIEQGRCLVDLRCIPSARDEEVVRAVLAATDLIRGTDPG